MQPESTVIEQIETLCKEVMSSEYFPCDCEYELSERIISIIQANRKKK